MPSPDALDRIDRRIATLEQRVSAVAELIDSQVDSLRVINGVQKHLPPSLSHPKIQHQAESLFELLLERVLQGYPQLPDDEQLVAEQFVTYAKETVDLVLFVTPDGVIRSANASLVQELGYRLEEITDRPVYEFIDLGYQAHLRELLKRQGDEPAPNEPMRLEDIVFVPLLCADGKRLSAATLVTRMGSGSDTLALVMRDISVHRRLVEELRESRSNYDALSETITEAIIRIDEKFEIVFANSGVKATFGFEPEELHGRSFSTLFPKSVYERNESTFQKYFVVDDRDRRRLGMRNTIEILGKQKHRGVAPMEMSFGNSKDYRGRTLTCIVRDITQRKNAERRLRHLAYHDQLTGLGNRDLFENDIRRLLETPEVFEAGYAALMFLDLDGFKQVNDTIGHDAGDQLLIQTGARLRKTLRESDGVYRFGGDEFVVLLSFIKDRRGAAIVANSILGEVRQPYWLAATSESRTSVSVGVSIGIAIIPDDGKTLAAVTKAADLAMYSAKESGKNRFAFYDQQLEARAQDRWSLEQGIRVSLERQEFAMSYQPLIGSSGTVLGMEALLRWNSPTHGEVPPRRFMPVAEETGMIIPLGSWAMETAFRNACAWPSVEGEPLLVSVNLSAKQFERSDLLESIGRVINRTRIDPARVIIEVTETCVMSAPERSITTLRALKDRYPGLSIAIDDFGTGYSSLSYLTRLPADIIKIDISFVSNLFAMNNEKIVRAVLDLGQTLGMRIIAEGVETAEQHAFFAGKGCFAFQGYHFHRPVPADGVTSIIEQYGFGEDRS